MSAAGQIAVIFAVAIACTAVFRICAPAELAFAAYSTATILLVEGLLIEAVVTW